MATRERTGAELRGEVEDLLYAYADCLDHGDITRWADFFTDDCTYNMAATAAEQWLTIFAARRPPRLINPEVWPAYRGRFEEMFGVPVEEAED